MRDQTPQRQVLHLAVKGIYFEQIKAGTKPWEYRLVTPVR